MSAGGDSARDGLQALEHTDKVPRAFARIQRRERVEQIAQLLRILAYLVPRRE